MTTIFESILHMSAVGSIVIFTVVIVRFFLKNAPKLYSYLLWAIVLLRLLCPFTVESPLSTIPGELPFESAVEELSEPYAYPSFTEPVINHTGESTNDELGEMYRPDSSDSYENMPGEIITPAPAAKTDWLHVLSIIWLCGVGVMAAWSIVGYVKLKRRLRGAMACEKNVYLSYKVDTPFVLGFLCPKIYLPAGISSEEWDYILMHERCHIRRGDHITRVLAFAALAIHWFNPLVWLAFVLSGRDMEMSCDESVLRSLGPQVRKAYSSSLLSLATGRPILSGMPLAFGEGDPKGRIRNLAKWRKPSLAMIIAAVLVCIVAAVCLLTDPVSPKAQINVYGSIYTYSGKEKKLPTAPGLIYLGRLEGITHSSSEPPTDTLHGTNLDPKYAGQDMLLPDISSLYLYDEEGFYLVFELDKDSERPKIPESPRTEVARGDFDRDGREDYIEVSKADPYSEALRIRLVDAETDIVLWTESTSVAEDEQKAFIHRIGEDGLDYIIIDSYDPAEEWAYSRTIYINDGREKVVERSEGELKLPQAESDEEFALYMSSSLPKNSIVMLSTLGGSIVIGPINRETELGLSGLLTEIEPEDIADDGYYYSNDFQPETLAEAMNALGEPADAVFSGEIVDWSYSFSIDGETNGAKKLYLKCGLAENLVQIVLQVGDKQQTAVYEDKALYTLLRHSRDVENNIDQTVSTEVYAAAEALMQNGLEEYAGKPVQFVDVELTVLAPHSGYERSDGSEVELYDFAYALIPSRPETLLIAGGAVMDGDLRVHGVGVSYMAVEYRGGRVVKYAPLWGGYFFPEGGLDAEDKEIIENALSSGFDVTPQDPIFDDGSSYPLAVPYGVSVVTDLDGDGVTETICQKVNESGYRIESITVNGVEYLDKVLELCLPYPNNAEADSIPSWYITDILSGDGKKEMTFYDGGPSADPVTFFFDYDKGELKYLGNIPYYSDSIKYSGDGYFTSWAKLYVFQTWFAEYTWSIFGPGGTVQNEPRDFYYVDFRFRDYTIGDEYFPGSDTSPLLREVRVYDKMDLSSEKGRLPIGTEISILGTDNVEWLLISDGSREYYLHINGPTIETPGGNYLEAQKVLNGLHYYG